MSAGSDSNSSTVARAQKHSRLLGWTKLPRYTNGTPQYDWRFISWLGFPNFGLSFAISVISTALPVILRARTGSNAILGLVVGGEGGFALVLPIITGALSDRWHHKRFGGRLPFMLASAPLAGAAVAILPLPVPLWVTAIFVGLFYVGYFTYYPPYTALYPDLVPRHLTGRAQGGQAFWRGIGFGGGLVGGILLFSVWHYLPFIVAGAILVIGTLLFAARMDVAPLQHKLDYQHRTVMQTIATNWQLVRHQAGVAWFLIANFFWEFSLAALRTFILLFLTKGLGRSFAQSSAIIAIVAGMVVIASLVAGRLGDRFGLRRVMLIAIFCYGLGLILPIFVNASVWLMLFAIPVIGICGAIVMTLPYGLLTKLLPAHSHGAASGLFNVSRGAGVVLGPYIAGVLIDQLHTHFRAHGYAAMWPAVAGSMLLSLPAVWMLRSALIQQRDHYRSLTH